MKKNQTILLLIVAGLFAVIGYFFGMNDQIARMAEMSKKYRAYVVNPNNTITWIDPVEEGKKVWPGEWTTTATPSIKKGKPFVGVGK